MLRNLFMILFRPQATVDRLLEERKMGQSWGATWFLIGVNLLAMVLIGIWFAGQFNSFMELGDPTGDLSFMDDSAILLMWIIIGVVGTVATVVSFILSRFFFKWLVVLGIRMVASREYPTDREERREKARLVELIQPYTMWIYVISTLISALVVPFLFDFAAFVEMVELSEMSGSEEVPPEFFTMFLGLIIWSLVGQLITLGLFIYMIIVRVFALKKIYNISAAKAFFGPFITFLIVYVVFFVLYFIFIFSMAMIPAVIDPSMV